MTINAKTLFDPKKKTIDERRINFIEIYENYNSTEAAGQAHRCLDCGNPYCGATWIS